MSFPLHPPEDKTQLCPSTRLHTSLAVPPGATHKQQCPPHTCHATCPLGTRDPPSPPPGPRRAQSVPSLRSGRGAGTPRPGARPSAPSSPANPGTQRPSRRKEGVARGPRDRGASPFGNPGAASSTSNAPPPCCAALSLGDTKGGAGGGHQRALGRFGMSVYAE